MSERESCSLRASDGLRRGPRRGPRPPPAPRRLTSVLAPSVRETQPHTVFSAWKIPLASRRKRNSRCGPSASQVAGQPASRVTRGQEGHLQSPLLHVGHTPCKVTGVRPAHAAPRPPAATGVQPERKLWRTKLPSPLLKDTLPYRPLPGYRPVLRALPRREDPALSPGRVPSPTGMAPPGPGKHLR